MEKLKSMVMTTRVFLTCVLSGQLLFGVETPKKESALPYQPVEKVIRPRNWPLHAQLDGVNTQRSRRLPAFAAADLDAKNQFSARSTSSAGCYPLIGQTLPEKAFRLQAESWKELVRAARPTFAWAGQDLMWITIDANGDPEFTLDRAYVYRPAERPLRWVLLRYEEEAPGGPRRILRGNNIRAVAKLHDKVPSSDHGAGDYAARKAAHPSLGVVYEIGWAEAPGGGSGHHREERRLYVLLERGGKWRFVGEGPTVNRGKSGPYTGSFSEVKSEVLRFTGRREPHLQSLRRILRLPGHARVAVAEAEFRVLLLIPGMKDTHPVVAGDES